MKTKQLFQSLLLSAGILSANFLNAQSICQAGFTFSVNNNVVTFTNTSTGAVQPSYYWNFGNGNYGWQTNPIYTYTNGTYYVCLTMWDSLSACQSTFCDTVIITNAPPVPCSANFSYGFQGNTFYFSDQSTGGPFISWLWNFGDGNTSTLQNPSHGYANAGTYIVCLTLYSQTDTCSYCDTLVYFPCNIQASFTFNSSNDPTVSFTSTSTGGNMPTYSWDFGDGNYGSGTSAVHTYQYNGTYMVCLTVQDSLSNPFCSDTYCDTVVITGGITPPCVAGFYAYPDSNMFPGSFSFVDISSGNPTGWYWTFGDGGTSNLQYPTHTYTAQGTYTVCLSITTPSGGCTTCDTVSYKLTGISESGNPLSSLKNYPNPFSKNTSIMYSLKEKAAVNVSVYNDLGLKVAELENSNREAGSHQIEWNAENLNSGVYFLEIKSAGNVVSRKMILIK